MAHETFSLNFHISIIEVIKYTSTRTLYSAVSFYRTPNWRHIGWLWCDSFHSISKVWRLSYFTITVNCRIPKKLEWKFKTINATFTTSRQRNFVCKYTHCSILNIYVCLLSHTEIKVNRCCFNHYNSLLLQCHVPKFKSIRLGCLISNAPYFCKRVILLLL